MVASNCLNISQPGYVVFDGTSTFTGNTFTAGTGITITNGSGIAGNTTIGLSGSGVAAEHLTGNTGGQLNPDGSNNFNTIGTGSITIAGSGSTLTTQLTGLTANSVLYGLGTATIGLVASGTTGQVLQTNTGAAPTYSTATYPSTTTINQILFSSAANTVSAIATANNGALITSNAGVPSILAESATAGIPLVSGGTGVPPAWTTAVVAGGGTGVTSFTAFAPIVGGTTTTGALQSTTLQAAGTVLTSTGTGTIPTFQAIPSSFSPNSTVQLVDDFIGSLDPSSATLLGALCWTDSGGFTAGTFPITNAHPGVIQNSAQTANGVSALILGKQAGGPPGFIVGGGIITVNWVFNVVALSNGTNRYILRMGMGDTIGAGDQVNGAYIEYSDNLNSGNWTYKTASASSRTTTNSAVTVTTGWHNAQVVINAAGNSITYFMDGVSLGAAITTNIPTTAISGMIHLIGVLGTTAANSMEVDLFYLTQTLTSAR